MTYCRFSTDDRNGMIRGYVGEGEFTDDPLETFGGAGVVKIPHMQDLLRYICENGFEHHVAANLSNTAGMVHEAASKYLGWEMYWHKDVTLGRMTRISDRCVAFGIALERFDGHCRGSDFGTLSVRVSIVDSERGGSARRPPTIRCTASREDPDHATQWHADHMSALARPRAKPLEAAGVRGEDVEAIALDTTGSSVIPVGEGLEPLDDYYLWCDHRAKNEAAEITEGARERKLEAIDWCGGVYSSEWGFSKLLHWLRHNPDKRGQLVTALEHCDMVAAVLCGITDPAAGAALRLRHGPQVDVECRRSAASRRGIPGRRRSAARGHPRAS